MFCSTILYRISVSELIGAAENVHLHAGDVHVGSPIAQSAIAQIGRDGSIWKSLLRDLAADDSVDELNIKTCEGCGQ
jgi:hypothetical protein